MDSRDNNGSNGETRYQMETEDGFLVSVPESKLESWLEAQRKPPAPLSRSEQLLLDRLVSEVYGSKE